MIERPQLVNYIIFGIMSYIFHIYK